MRGKIWREKRQKLKPSYCCWMKACSVHGIRPCVSGGRDKEETKCHHHGAHNQLRLEKNEEAKKEQTGPRQRRPSSS